ncbi:hypothetical protein [Lentzea sp. HUAS12]|uniref:hypothetical protein n=1 Tax=Lentzea sp. HUAS12 TaxID=2951806 RepID=UPI00209F7B08|nr:hypothetical protein [Lentzea sp. HUAS12]USX53906.1 hypothetical protein ND450_07330 [Lentzea sp. HUAS12]
MAFRRALVLGTGIAGLTTAYRLLRSDWDVTLTGPVPSHRHAAYSGPGLDAARRLGLLPRTGSARADLVPVLRAALGDLRTAADIRSRVPDDCGVTVTFADGTQDWFDLVVDTDWSPDDPSLAVAGAELLGDAFDIHTDTTEAWRWWYRTMRSYARRRTDRMVTRRRGYRAVVADPVRLPG